MMQAPDIRSVIPARVPVLETARLLLRGHTQADHEACVQMWADPIVTRYTIGAPSPPQRTWQRLLAYLGHWSLLGYGYWAVEDKQTGRYIGEMGFADFKRDAPAVGSPELGWALAPHAHGRGLATEGLRAAVAWADACLEARETFCIIHPDNGASLRIADKLGFARRDPSPSAAEDNHVLARPRAT